MEIHPNPRQDSYAALEQDRLSPKQWFFSHGDDYLRDGGELSLAPMVANGNDEDSRYK